MFKQTELLLAIFFFIFLQTSLSYAASMYREGDFIVVEASGQGRTIREARIDARRNATQQALGFIMQGSTTYRETHNGKELQESILRISRGSIGDNEKELKHSEENGRHKVTLQVKIRGDFLRGLLRDNFNESTIDGLSLVSRAQRREQWEKEAGDTLLEVIGTFPVAQYVNVGVSVGEDAFSSGTSKLNMDIHITFDRTGYFRDVVPNLLTVLDYIADAVVRNVPFFLPSEQVKRNKTTFTTINPPLFVKNVSQYLKLMGIEKQNRYIDTVGGGFANIYILTSDYYFNAYRIAPTAFTRFVENLFIERNGRLTGRSITKVELIIDFLNKQKQSQYQYTTPIGLQAAMFFLNVAPMSQAAWDAKKHGPIDESRHALFIFPAIGLTQANDYQLVEEENDRLTIPLSREKLMDVTTTLRLKTN